MLKKDVTIIKVKARMSSTDLNDTSLRVVYAIDFQEAEITFIEMYSEHEKDTEDKQRWREYK